MEEGDDGCDVRCFDEEAVFSASPGHDVRGMRSKGDDRRFSLNWNIPQSLANIQMHVDLYV